MLTADMEEVVERLGTDWKFIELFLNEPEMALKNYQLNKEEKQALLARSPDDLVILGVDKLHAEIALSGAHSQTCPNPG